MSLLSVPLRWGKVQIKLVTSQCVAGVLWLFDLITSYIANSRDYAETCTLRFALDIPNLLTVRYKKFKNFPSIHHFLYSRGF